MLLKVVRGELGAVQLDQHLLSTGRKESGIHDIMPGGRGEGGRGEGGREREGEKEREGVRTTGYYARREGGGGREREGEGGRGRERGEREGYRTLCQAHHNFLFLFKLSTNTTVPVCTAWGHGGMEQRLQNHPHSSYTLHQSSTYCYTGEPGHCTAVCTCTLYIYCFTA